MDESIVARLLEQAEPLAALSVSHLSAITRRKLVADESAPYSPNMLKTESALCSSHKQPRNASWWAPPKMSSLSSALGSDVSSPAGSAAPVEAWRP